MYQALYRKWRPRTFDDVVGQSHITRTLKRQVAADHLSHAYLFTGTRGTGKTTCAKLLAKAVNCEHPVEGNPCGKCPACLGIDSGSILDVVELDAASNNGVDQVRALRDEAVYTPAAVRRRVYIIDEVHMLSMGAFNALLKILEEPPEYVIFILATTELHKVPATILSRCQRFSFKRIQAADIQNRLLYIAGAEGIDLTKDGAALLARLADGALRDALSLLDQCSASGARVDRETVLDVLGLAGNTKTAHIMNHIRRGDAGSALTEFGELYSAGKEVGAVLSELSGLTRDLLLRQTAGTHTAGLLTGGYDEATMQTLSRGFSPQRLLHMLTLLQDAQARLKTSANRRTDAELCLIQLCDKRLDGSVLSLSERLGRVEAAMAREVTLAAPAEGSDRPFVPEPIPEPIEEEEPPLPAGETTAAEPFPTPQTEERPPREETPPPQLPESEPQESLELISPPESKRFEPPRRSEPELPTEPELTVPLPEPLSPEPKSGRPAPRKRASRWNSDSGNRCPAAGGGGEPQLWQELLPELWKSDLGPIACGFVVKQLISGLYDGEVLTLYAAQESVKTWFSRADHMATLQRLASARAGKPVRVAIEVGTPKAGAVAPHAPQDKISPSASSPQKEDTDPMKELLAFAQNEGKEIVTIDES